MANSRELSAGGLRRVAAEQAALRRVAMLVARGVEPDLVFAVVAEEVSALFNTDLAMITRLELDGELTVMAGHGLAHFEPGARFQDDPRLAAIVSAGQTGRASRFDADDPTAGDLPDGIRAEGARSLVDAPILVEGRVWGSIGVGSRRGRLSPDTEQRLAGFTELAAIAIINAQARAELRDHAREQAALRRVATLVARAAPPEEVFVAVATEAGQVLAADITGVTRYDPDGTGTVLGTWSRTGATVPVSVGTRLGPGERNMTTLVFKTGRPTRIDDYADATGPTAVLAREWGVRSVVGAPVSVAGRLWGAMVVGSTGEQPLPTGTEARLAGFTELAATAIASAQARVELRDYAEEQAALRRVATLVARTAPPEEVFAAVTAEAGRLLGAQYARMSRYDRDSTVRVVATWSSTGAAHPVGTRTPLGGRNLYTLVFQTGRAARIDDYADASGPAAGLPRELGVRASVGVPVIVEGRMWGAIFVGSTQEPLPAGTEERLAGFTELAGTAIANAEAQAALTASRARIVATADQTRRRIERDLHDGVQQRLVSLALRLREVQAAPPEAGELAERLEGAVTEATGALEELREIARGLHPTVLAKGGLRPALRALARRSAVPVRLDIQVAERLPEPVEIAAYYAVSEALTNAAKHARASAAEVEVTAGEGILHVRVRDDGRGGADFGHGSGLIGLRDRMEALGGRISLLSPPGEGTTLYAELPLTTAAGVTS